MAKISNSKISRMRNDITRLNIEVSSKMKTQISKNDKKRNMLDAKLASIVVDIKKELKKRNIDISDDNFDIKIDEIIEFALQYQNINRICQGIEKIDIRNAVKRSINKEINQEIR